MTSNTDITEQQLKELTEQLKQEKEALLQQDASQKFQLEAFEKQKEADTAKFIDQHHRELERFISEKDSNYKEQLEQKETEWNTARLELVEKYKLSDEEKVRLKDELMTLGK